MGASPSTRSRRTQELAPMGRSYSDGDLPRQSVKSFLWAKRWLAFRPPAEVFATLNSFQRFNEWSPWFDLDPNAKYTYSGPIAGVGAKMAWVGNSAVGSGSQEIIESVPGDRIVNALDFGGSQAMAGYRLAAEGSGTRVSWSMDSAHGYNPVNRWFGALLLDSVVGKDYEKGLAKLKVVLESGPRQ